MTIRASQMSYDTCNKEEPMREFSKKGNKKCSFFFSLGMNPMFLRTKIYLYNFYLSSLDGLED